MKITARGLAYSFLVASIAASTALVVDIYNDFHQRTSVKEGKLPPKLTRRQQQEIKELKAMNKTLEEFLKRTCGRFKDCERIRQLQAKAQPPGKNSRKDIFKIERKPAP
ncbi:MAG: hypothetical protein H6853_07715 [Rhodospirillales bacterium]|nr:hypothetical protein [Alphaproteobacteria bacterium]USO03406.1 MAG: hypothetical protein H6853_07715 [Rhodospirillales bacterium]